MARYWSKIADCNVPHFYLVPSFGLTPMLFRRDLWHQKNRVHRLSYGVICVISRLAVLVQYRRVTDGRTDTRRQHIPRLREVIVMCATACFDIGYKVCDICDDEGDTA